MDTITWSELGSPPTPVTVRVEGKGNVEVTQKNIDDVKGVGGDPEFDLIDNTAMGNSMRSYVLGLMR